MKKNVLISAVCAAVLGLAGLIHAGGFPTQFSLNGVVGNSGNGGQVFGAATSAAGTPLLLCSSPANCGWLESVVFDTAKGATATVTVTFYDATSTATCAASNAIYTFTRVTGTPAVLGSLVAANTVGLPPASRIDLDSYVHSNLYVNIDSANASTITGSVVLGKPTSSVLSVVK